jgi:hypothetical protein
MTLREYIETSVKKG